MSQKSKNISVLLLIGVLLSVLLIAISLPSLQLQTGQPFPGWEERDIGFQTGSTGLPFTSVPLPLLQGLIAFISLILIIYLLVRLVSLSNLKQILRLLLLIGALFLLAYLMPEISPGEALYFPSDTVVMPEAPDAEYAFTPLGQPPKILIWIVLAVIALGVLLFGGLLLKNGLAAWRLEKQLMEQAENAVNDLIAGMDFRNVILRCYMQMTALLQEDEGIQRGSSMTVQEFEEILEAKGFPAAPVHQLTQLFEKVRYGRQQISKGDEGAAVDSLNEIISFCRNKKEI